MGTVMRCHSCSGPLVEEEPFCPRCGTGQDVAALPTGTAPRALTPRAATPGQRSPSPRQGSARTSGGHLRSSTVAHGRFVPGAVLSERYRIVELLGRGGMGEVYRADDLTLDQPVALKFLPVALQHDLDRRERFYDEVRLARQVAHPSVCRVYDVIESDGTPFLSMEYVDGEDLASLLRRIGRLPEDKALEIARQLCAGVASAHEKGVLHRDLKPENVMIDGRGHVRITDFGLAVAADAVEREDVRSGTPAYMSPEQLAGREVTVRSDVYALGLVLFELFTGRRAFEAANLRELERKQQDVTAPSDIVPDIDPAVERAILHCLERDPARRPSSALAVAAALPGGDPLAAALAAGETPSPELVAAAGTVAGLRASSAWALLAACAASTLLLLFVSAPLHLLRRLPFTKPPAVLEDHARDLLQRVSHVDPPYDSARGYDVDDDYLQAVTARDRSPRRWDQLASGPSAVRFWYRQGPRSLYSNYLLGRVLWGNPPPLESGMAGAMLDPGGRLVELYVVPPQLEAADGAVAVDPHRLDWGPLFGEAGLDLTRFHEVTPRWAPPLYADGRMAWDGVHPDRPDVALHVEGAAFRGRLVWFDVLPPWARPERMVPFQADRSHRVGEALSLTFLLSIVCAAALLARRHVGQGRGDMAGARRLARYMVMAGVVGWLLFADHVFDARGELSLAVRGVGSTLLLGLVIWTLYLALEPYVRRRWPQVLIGWTRLLAGRWRDPLVGRDALIGCAAGGAMALVAALAQRLPQWLGQPAFQPAANLLDTLLGPREILAELVYGQSSAAGGAMACVLVLLLARRLVGNLWVAAVVALVVLAIPDMLVVDVPVWLSLPIDLLLDGILVFVLVRYGLLAGVVTLYVVNRLLQFPLTSDFSSWTATPTLWALAVMVALAVYGFRTALAGRPALMAGLLTD
jgi:eukaryotic-like serine/threonine-protein kinase